MYLENIMENGAFALLEQMFHFPYYFQKYSKLNLNFYFIFFQCCLKIENDAPVSWSKNSLWSKGLKWNWRFTDYGHKILYKLLLS